MEVGMGVGSRCYQDVVVLDMQRSALVVGASLYTLNRNNIQVHRISRSRMSNGPNHVNWSAGPWQGWLGEKVTYHRVRQHRSRRPRMEQNQAAVAH